MRSVVSAVYSVPPGEVWPEEAINDIKTKCEAHGLVFDIVESVPVHEDIKLGKPTRDKLIDVYCENIRRLGKAGIKVICYNFMPVFDWLRSDLSYKNEDGSTSLVYRDATVLSLDPRKGDLSLPGWDESYTKDGLAALLKRYEEVNADKLFENMVYFLEKIIPVCEECDVKMAVHPDDPPWSLFDLPRIVCDEKGIDRIFAAVDSKYNGITLCTGSLGANRGNDLVKMAAKYAKMGRVHFLHARNIKFTDENPETLFFHESPHPTECGSLDIYGILRALYENGFDGYTRPDHGRNIWGEDGRPGYGLYDRALGAMYLSGLWEAIKKTLEK
jgi:mannonate dehydratase